MFLADVIDVLGTGAGARQPMGINASLQDYIQVNLCAGLFVQPAAVEPPSSVALALLDD
jgi:hypothetical protein